MATASAKKTIKPTNGKSVVKKKADSYRLDLHVALQEHFGHNSFKGNQEKIIESLLAGHDTFVIKPTGGGKSLCYQLPALVSEGVAIIVSPLIALMKNQVDLVRSYSSKDDVAHFLNSTLTKKEIKEVHDDLTDGQNKNVICCPRNIDQTGEPGIFQRS